MNKLILLNGPPKTLNVDGIDYDIYTSYRVALAVLVALEDPELHDYERNEIILKGLFKQRPHNIDAALLEACKFLDVDDGGNTNEVLPYSDGLNGTRKYSFKQDGKYIYRAVDEVLHGRLSDGELVHWWDFILAFMEIPEDCTMSRLIAIRCHKEKGKMSKEDEEYYIRNKHIVDLEEIYDKEEQELLDLIKQLG